MFECSDAKIYHFFLNSLKQNFFVQKNPLSKRESKLIALKEILISQSSVLREEKRNEAIF